MKKLILSAVVLVGCGDPAAPFVGTWRGTTIVSISANGKTVSDSSAGSLAISEDLASGDLMLDDGCGSVATVRGIEFSVIKSSGCVIPRTTGTCRVLLTIASGVGLLRNDTLNIAYDGASDFDQCPSGGAPFSGTYKMTFTGNQ